MTSLDIGQAMKVQDVILPAGLTAVDHADDAVASVIAVRAALQVAEGEVTEGEGGSGRVGRRQEREGTVTDGPPVNLLAVENVSLCFGENNSGRGRRWST